jgi:hypothetical protein
VILQQDHDIDRELDRWIGDVTMKEEKQDYLATIFLAVFFLSIGFLMQFAAWWLIFTGKPEFQLFSMVMIYGGIWMIYFGTIIPTSSSESRPEYRKASRFPTAPKAGRIPVQQAYAIMGSQYDYRRGGRPPMPRAGRTHPQEGHRVY